MQVLKDISASAIEKFVSENSGEIVDIADGSLIDNLVYSFPFGTMFCFEDYLNSWSSAYVCYFFHKDRERGINKMWDRFYMLKAREENESA